MFGVLSLHSTMLNFCTPWSTVAGMRGAAGGRQARRGEAPLYYVRLYQ